MTKIPINITADQAPPESITNHLMTLYQKGQLAEVVEQASQFAQEFPHTFMIWSVLGAAASQIGNTTLAESALRQAMAIDPNNFNAPNNLANVLGSQGKLDEAIAAYRQAICLKPDYAEAYNNMAVALKDQGKFDEAIAACQQALTLMPDYAEAYNNMAIALKNQGKYDEAITAYQGALALKPDCTKTYFNMANAFNDQGKLDKALTAYKEVLNLKPDYDDAKTNLSHLILRKGELKKGFELMEFRMHKKVPKASTPRKNFIWHPEQGLQGKHFVVYEEQGLGDIMQFCRYLPLLEQRGANVSFKVTPKLHTLLNTLESRTTLIEALPAEESIDFEAPLLSLPHLLCTTLENVPAPTPYLYADHDRIKMWSKILSKQTFKIGICWQGNIHNENAVNGIGRSFSVSLFAGLAQIPDVELISLHKGEGEGQLANIDFPVTTLGSNFDAGNDAFVDTAAVMTLCNLIITSDTSIAHLAGAMGCQTWVALQYAPDWRWMLNRTDSPWYPTMTLYRQHHPCDWQGAFTALEHDVRALLNQKNIL